MTRASGFLSRVGGSSPFVAVAAVVVAAVLPLTGLLLASRWASSEVTASTVAGARSTSRAVAQQVDQSYQEALVVLEAAPSRPTLRRALLADDRMSTQASLSNLRASGPFFAVGLFDASGRLIGQTPGSRPPPPAWRAGTRSVVVEGPLREVGIRSLRSVTVPVTSGRRILGFVTAEIDVGRLIPDAAALRFARTGKSIVVGIDTRVIIDSDPADVGLYLETPANQRLARSHRAGTVAVTSVLTHRKVIEVYEPVAGQPWGVLTSQSTSEAFAGVDRLTHRLHLLAGFFAVLGLVVAGLVAATVWNRNRRIRTQASALHAAQRMFRSAFDSAPTGVALVRLDGRFRQVNRSLCELTGYSESEMLTRTFTDLTHPDDRGPDVEAAEKLIVGQADQLSIEKRYVRADGRTVWVAVRSAVVPDGQGRPDHFVAHFTDITERRAAAAAMTEANERLGEARDTALAATAAKSAFLATMSHEIRTPMNGVIGMTGLLLDTPLDAEQRELTETVRDSGEALLVIINDVLDFSKIEAGDLELEVVPFELRSCVESALSVVAVAADRKGLELVAELDGSCPELVLGDATRFRQVIVNLLGNAVKFTETGEVHVVVAAEWLPGQDDRPVRVTVSVRDSGIGIPAERMDRLFQAFSQVDSSTTRIYGGSGLGLVISRRLARAMGGDLAVASQVGLGSTFTFTAEVGGTDDRRVDPAHQTTDLLAGRSALIVDDSATSRRVLGLLLRRWGMICTEVSAPEDALEPVAAGRRFDVAVLDMDMPGMDGADLAVALRAFPAGAELPLILLTSLQRRLPPEQRVLFGATITKPVRSDILHDKLLDLLEPAETAVLAVQTAGGQRRTDGPASLVGPARPRPASPWRPAPVTSVGRAQQPGAGVGASLRVLLAEDNQVNQRVAQLMLAKLGHRVDTVSDGLQAVQAVKRTAYDVVLMDLQMPRLDGHQATARIRAEVAANRQPRIVAMTASVLADDRAACLAAGMDGYISKPVRLADLGVVLAEGHPLPER